MNKEQIIEQLNQEITQLQTALNALKGGPVIEHKAVKTSTGEVRSYKMNSAARKRLSDAQKERWEKIRAERLQKERDAVAKMQEFPSSANKSAVKKSNKKAPSSS